MITIDMAKASRQDVMLGTPVCGQMTVVSTSSVSVKAGASVLSGRRSLFIRNKSACIAVRLGPSSITDYSGGTLLEPGDAVEYNFDPSTAVEIYARSTGAAVTLDVQEAG